MKVPMREYVENFLPPYFNAYYQLYDAEKTPVEVLFGWAEYYEEFLEDLKKALIWVLETEEVEVEDR